MRDLNTWANWATILTAGVPAGGYGLYQWRIFNKRTKLEAYLKQEKEKGTDKGQRSILHLMAKVGLTETEILKASHSSKHIIQRVTSDPKTSRADTLLFEYKE